MVVCQHGCVYTTIQSAATTPAAAPPSVAYGHGDSGFYVGGTRPQQQPQTTTLDHLTAYKNVFGFSGSNSKYMVIRDSEF